MCIYVGATVVDKRFPENKLGRVIFVNPKTQVALIDTAKGVSAVPSYMIEVINKNGGSQENAR